MRKFFQQKKQKLLIIVLCLISSQHAMANSPLEDFSNHMQYLAERDKTLSENLANADTPNYKPQELKRQEGANPSGISLAQTHPNHFSFENNAPYETTPGEILEVKPNGNAVTVEHELTKKKENAMLLAETVNIYNRAREMNKTALVGVR